MPALAPAPTALGLGADLEHRVTALWWLLSRELPSDLSRTAASVLATLRAEGPLRVTTLASRESISQPAMTLLLQRLEKHALVTRGSDPDDRRACRITVTPAGEDALAHRSAGRSHFLEARLARLGEPERTALLAALPALDSLLAMEPTP